MHVWAHSRFSVAVVAVVVHDVEANSLRTHQQPGVAKPEPTVALISSVSTIRTSLPD